MRFENKRSIVCTTNEVQKNRIKERFNLTVNSRRTKKVVYEMMQLVQFKTTIIDSFLLWISTFHLFCGVDNRGIVITILNKLEQIK